MKKCQTCGYVGDAGESFCSPCYRKTKKFVELVREDSLLFGRASNVLGSRFIYSETLCGSCDSEIVGREFIVYGRSKKSFTCLVCYMNANGLTPKNFYKTLKVSVGCELLNKNNDICGFNEESFALEFDHIDSSKKYRTKSGKLVEPSDLFRTCSVAVFCVEIINCDIACSNHHKIKTARERGLA